MDPYFYEKEKREMAETQLHFVKYAAEEILEYIRMGGRIEEWYQNKLSKVHSDMEGMHSWMEGEKRRTGMVKEESTELQEGRPSQRHPLEDHDYHKKEEVEDISELSMNKLTQYKTTATKSTSDDEKSGNHEKGNKRFSNIMKAMKNQFAPKCVEFKKTMEEDLEHLEEKNVPTSPEKWSRAKSMAKSKFDVYPCVPLDSLAISRNGPVTHEDLNIGDEILTYNMNKDVLEWKPVLHKHFYENAPLLEIGKPTGFSIRCTPNHKWVVSRKEKKELVETKDLNTHMKIIMCAVLENDTSLLLENWSKKDDWVEKILSMNMKEREIFLDSSVVYDGWDKGVSSKIKDRHTFGFVQKEYDHLWASLLAAYLNGYYVNTSERGDMTGATYIRNKKYHSTQNLYKKESGIEDVWCPTTENETWVMIQNGLITITGNSAYANGWAAKKYKEMGGGWKSVSEDVEVNEDLRKWFDKDNPEGGWKRINSKGEAVGPCAREPGEPKPKCMSNEKRASLTKKERASAVRAKRKHDSDPERKGDPINVSNYGKGKISEQNHDVPFDAPYSTKKTPVKDKSGAVHGPMSVAKHLARMAIKRQSEKMKKPVSESLQESRRSEIVREAMRDAKLRDEKKRKEGKMEGKKDIFEPDPTLTSQIVKT